MAETTNRQDETTEYDTGREGPVAKKIEQHTSKIPSDVFLWGAVGSMGVSLALKCMGRKHDALFVGQWAAPFLLLGIYNKIVKIGGHDSETEKESRQRENAWGS